MGMYILASQKSNQLIQVTPLLSATAAEEIQHQPAFCPQNPSSGIEQVDPY
jgi:hypothetical protein